MKVQKDMAATLTYQKMMTRLEDMTARYPFIELGTIGESVLGRSIPLLTIGKGEKSLLYVGAHSGTDWMCTALLLRYVEEFCSCFEKGVQAFRYSVPYLFSARCVYIVPMLNPDGVEYVGNGLKEDNPLYERVFAMNGGNVDFSDWRGNARGVELSRNYSFGFPFYKQLEGRAGILGGGKCGFSGEMPESEPETASLCNFLNYHAGIRAVLSLHSEGEKILYTAGKKTAPRSVSIGNALSRLTGYPLIPYDGWESIGGLSAWCIDACNIPAFSVACGGEANDGFETYATLREALFTMPTMI